MPSIVRKLSIGIASTVLAIAVYLPGNISDSTAWADGIGIGVGASIGGSGGGNAGLGASIGGHNGVTTGLGASVGGRNGVNAGAGANIGGRNGVTAGLGASVGGRNGVVAGAGASVGSGVNAGVGAKVGNGIGLGVNVAIGGGIPNHVVIDPAGPDDPVDRVRTSSVADSRIISASTRHALAGMSSKDLTRYKKRCKDILSGAGGYDSDLVALCRVVHDM